jgi:O-acetylhomoserine (thiol)-lyase
VSDYGFSTLSVHAGAQPDPTTGARATPIYQTTAFVFEDADHAAALFNLQVFGNIYSRIMNPTNAVLEERVAALEGGRAALSCASGHAAQLLALHTLMEPGANIVAARQLYGGSVNQFSQGFAKFGWHVKWADTTDPGSFKALINNTLSSPYLIRPIEWGADIVVHSATKFLGGHGNSMAGIIVDAGKFDYGSGKYPALSEPCPSYHGMRLWETFGDMAFAIACRVLGLRDLGPALAPMNAFLVQTGIETLPLRMQKHCDNALQVAKWLKASPKVSWVNYAGLPDNPSYALHRKYCPKGAGSVFTFGLRGGYEAGVKMVNSVKLFSHLANLGDTRSLIIHPASTTHRQLSDEDRVKAGAGPDVVRLSVGIEDAADIIADLEQAMA